MEDLMRKKRKKLVCERYDHEAEVPKKKNIPSSLKIKVDLIIIVKLS